jgi:hypothetical protein
MARNTPMPTTPLRDSAPASQILDEFEVPDLDGLHQERTQDFGSIRVLALRRLTPQQEKWAAIAAKGEGILLAFELARRSIVWVKNERDELHNSSESDGSSESLWLQMGSKLRTLVIKAYSTLSVPDEDSTAAFLKSRRTRA